MNEMQMAAAKKAGLAILVAVALIAIFKVSPIIAILIIFLGAVGIGSYNIFLDIERSKERAKEFEKKYGKSLYD